jgi:hypothetical protein
MSDTQLCPDCGAFWSEGVTCTDHFHHMLFWEAEFPLLGEVHHLMVLCYHLQHPALYSPEGLRFSRGLLEDFVARGISPAEIRQRDRDKVDSGKRNFKITGRPGAQGIYPQPVHWTMTAADVVAGGAEQYIDNVRAWARSVYESLKPLAEN